MTTRSRKNLLFTTLSLFSILGYGFFVFAAPPGLGGYNPGETLDPQCTPGDLLPNPCIVKLPLTTADNGLTVTGSNVQLGGELLQSTQIKQNGNDFYFTGGKVGVGTSSPQFTLDVGGISQYSVGVISFSGTLDDLSVDSSNYSATIPITYSLSVATVSAPDEINWNDDQGNTGTFQISGSQILSYGVQVTFANTSGHTGDESWVFTVNKTPSGIMNVSEQVNIGGNFFAAQNQNLSTFIGNGVGNFRDINNAFFAGSSAGFNAINANYSNFIGSGAGYNAMNAYNSNFLGNNAGAYATSAYNSNFIGTNTGNSATDAHDSTFIGGDAGSSSTYAFESVFLGNGTGSSAPNANNSVFIGQRAGQKSVSANTSVFIGQESGANSDNASNSVFLGNLAGQGSFNAMHSIFIGDRAGQADVVDNVSLNGWSILIGDSTNTGGFSNSIALGANAVNTASDQFYLTDTITQMSLRGINYTLPVADGNLGDVLTTDSAGGLSWAPAGSSGSGPKWYAENAAAPGTAPVATGAGSIALGDNAEALNFDMFVFGKLAGLGATNAASSIFIGSGAGSFAVDSSNSVFIGNSAGNNATSATFSNFIGGGAGNGAINAANSIFMGKSAGVNDIVNNTAAYNEVSTFANTSILIGHRTSTGGFSNSIALGAYATNTATNQFMIGSTNRPINSVFIGDSKGTASTNFTFFAGAGAGLNATSASNSIFIGRNAGNTATSASGSVFIGLNAGQNATSASNSIFLGQNAGANATGASASSFMGRNAGSTATNASQSTFLGNNAGSTATNASQSTFLGNNAGLGSVNASNSIAIGYAAGQDLVLNNTGNVNDYSIMIGNGTGAGGFSNSIALGWQTINTASNQFMIGSTTRPINETRFQGSIIGTQCTITTGTGIACTSDERLKENIIDLTTGTLEKLMNIRTVNYQLNSDSTNKLQIGFLAQNLEQYFPELVDTDRNSGYKSVYYAQMTPILVEAIREMNLKVTSLSDMARTNTWRDAMIAWFGNAANGIEQFVAGTIKARTQVCIDDVCVNKQQLQQILQNNGINQSTPIVNTLSPVDPGTNPGTGDSTSVDTGDIPTDPSVSPTDSPLPSGDSSGNDIGSAPTAE